MKKSKLLSVLVLLIILSCSKEESDNEKINNFNIKETYEAIIYGSNTNKSSSNTNDIDMDAYLSLTNSQKASLWGYKYSLFENSTSLTNEQTQVLNEIKTFTDNSVINNSYDENEALELDLIILEHFTIDQYFDLMFYLNNPSISSGQVTAKGCFWCNEIIDQSDCRLTTINGRSVVVKDITFRRRRAFIGWSTGTATVECSDAEIYDQYDNIF